MSKSFNVNEPVQTRDGRKARIICTDVKGTSLPIGALITDKISGKEVFYMYYSDGKFAKVVEHGADLVNIPKRITGWMNIWITALTPSTGSAVYPTKAEANDAALRQAKHSSTYIRLACIYVDIPEGHGIE